MKAVNHTVATFGPWKFGAQRESEIVEAVGNDDIVVEADDAVDDDGSEAETAEQWCHVLEHVRRAEAGELADGGFEEKERNANNEQHDKEWDEEWGAAVLEHKERKAPHIA